MQKPTTGAPLTAALIRAGNLPADEQRLNAKTHDKLFSVFYDLAVAAQSAMSPLSAFETERSI